MQTLLSYPLLEASARFDSFFVCGPYQIPNSKKTIWGKKKRLSPEMQTFVLKPSDGRFLSGGIPKAYIRGQLRANGTQTELIARFPYPIQMYVFYCALAVLSVLWIDILWVIALTALLPTVKILTYNSTNKEDLLKTISLIFEEQNERREEHNSRADDVQKE